MNDETGGIRVGAFGTAIFGLVLFGLSGLAAARAVRTLRPGADVPRSEHWEALQTLAMVLWLGLLVPAFALLMTGLVPSVVSVCLMFLPAFAMGICWVAGTWVRHQERIAVERAHRDLQLPMARRMWQPPPCAVSGSLLPWPSASRCSAPRLCATLSPHATATGHLPGSTTRR
ncbi:hypothetical protein ABT213_33455 [Streptomyces sp. NPDC001674]|uniref:hypothetical protein n=1 Tax=Streptomyces sp. NPDC001674 TaxID=3154394 RepID=UPI00331A9232